MSGGPQVDSLEIQIKTWASSVNKDLDNLLSKLKKINKELGSTKSAANKATGSTKSSSGNTGGSAAVRKEAKEVNRAAKESGSLLSNLTSDVTGLFKSSRKSQGSLQRLASTFGTLNAALYPVIRTAHMVGDAIEKSMDYVETYNYFSVTMDKIGKEFGKDFERFGYEDAETYAQSFSDRLNQLTKKMTGYEVGGSGELLQVSVNNLGLDPEALMNFEARVAAVTNSVGLMGEVSVNTTKALTMLSSDLSSLTNTDLSSVMTNLQSGLIGQSRALYKYGIDITNATLQTYAYELGVNKALVAMTQAEKMQLRLIAILDQSRVAWGDQANTINSVANQYRIMRQQFSNLARTIGNLFLPVVQLVLPFINGLVMAITKLLNVLGFKIHGGNWLKDLQDGISGGAAGVEGLEDDLEDATSGMDSASAAAKKLKTHLLGIDELNVVEPETPDTSTGGVSGSGGGGGSIDLSDEIGAFVDEYERIWNEALNSSENKAYEWMERIIGVFKSKRFEELGSTIGNSIKKGLEKINWNKVYSAVGNFGKGLADFLNGLISPGLFGEVAETVAGVLNSKFQFLNSFGTTFDWKNFGLSIATGINRFFSTFDFGLTAQTFNTFAIGFLDSISEALANIDWAQVGEQIGTFLANIDYAGIFARVVKIIGQTLKGAFEGLSGAFGEAPLQTVVVSLLGISRAIDLIKKSKYGTVLKNLGDVLKDVFGAFKNDEKAIKRLAKQFPKLSEAISAFTREFNLRTWQGKSSISSIFNGAQAAVKKFSSQLSKAQKVAIGALGVFANFSLAKSGFDDLSEGAEGVASGLGKIAAGAAASAAALKLIGVSNIWTAAITGVTTLVAGIVNYHQKLREREELELYGDTLENVTQKWNEQTQAIRDRMQSSQELVTSGVAEAEYAQNLADRYYELASQQSLSNEEEAEMRDLASQLVETVPTLENYYNTKSGLLTSTKEQTDALIDSMLEEIRLESTKEALKEAYQARIDAYNNLKQIMEESNGLIEKKNQLESDIATAESREKMAKEYRHLQTQIRTATGDTSELEARSNDLWVALTENGKNADGILTEYWTSFGENARRELDSLVSKNEEVFQKIDEARQTYLDTDTYVVELETSLSNQMQGVETSIAEGLGINSEDGQRILKESAVAVSSVYTEDLQSPDAFDINSPSKKMVPIGESVIEGIGVGFENGVPVALESINSFSETVVNAFKNTFVKQIENIAIEIPRYFKKIFESIKQTFDGTPEYFYSTFRGAYQQATNAWSGAESYFRTRWTGIKSVFRDVKTFFKEAFQEAFDAVTKIWSGSEIESHFKKIANKMVSPIGNAVNGIIDGVNWIMGSVGGTKLKNWSVPRFKSGTDGLDRDTLGLVNDQKGATYRELIVPPDGNAFIPKGRNVLLPLQKGTKIMPAKETKSFMGKIPRFEKGVGDFIGNWKTVASFTGDVLDYLDRPREIVQIAIDKFTDTSGWTGIYKDMATGVVETTLDETTNFVKKVFSQVVGKGVEGAVRWAIKIANDNRHGYDQASRWGNPDYDCSSLAISAFEQAGIKLKSAGATYTGNMYNAARKIGFADVTDQVRLGSGAGLKRGDILLSRGNHTAIYIGNGQVVQASSNEFGGIRGGRPGDQTGREIAVRSYYNFPWTDVLRYFKAYKNGIGRISFADLIPAYREGGFVEDGLFYANRNELVGQFTNGRTAVANNEMIVKGIENGVYKAMIRAQSENTRETSLLEELISAVREGRSITIDGRELVAAYDNRKMRNGFSFT